MLSEYRSATLSLTSHEAGPQTRRDGLSVGSKRILIATGTAAIAGAILWALATTQQIHAQSAPLAGSPAPSFEVASVRRSDPQEQTSTHFLPGRLVLRNTLMIRIIALAYGRDFGDSGFRYLRPDRIVGGPDWIRPGQLGPGEGYDIVAKVDDSLAAKFGNRECGHVALMHGRCIYRQTMVLMLRSLLADRFKLQVRHETKEGPVYDLVVAKGGSKLSTCSLPFSSSDTAAIPPRPSPCPPGVYCIDSCMPTSLLAEQLSFQVPQIRPVIDQTGLNGSLNVKLQFAEANVSADTESEGSNLGMESSPPVGPVGPSVFKAIQDQLGLKLKATKGPVETLVIEHIERPSQN